MTPQRSLRRAYRLLSRITSVNGYSREKFREAYEGRYLPARRRGLALGAFTRRGPGPKWLRDLKRLLKEETERCRNAWRKT